MSALAAAPSLREFLDGVRQGRATVQRCTGCGALAVPPKVVCPACEATGWEAATLGGDGEIASYTVIRVAPARVAHEAPYAIAVVRMAEGVSLLGRVVGVAPDALRVGLPVRLVAPADASTEVPVLAFAPR